jgi:hypothetical protein
MGEMLFEVIWVALSIILFMAVAGVSYLIGRSLHRHSRHHRARIRHLRH